MDNAPRTDEIALTSDQLESWIQHARSSNSFKYARYLRELMRTLPKEQGLQLLRTHLLREQRFEKAALSDLVLEAHYYMLV